MYKSQFWKIAPYDWFCAPGSQTYTYINVISNIILTWLSHHHMCEAGGVLRQAVPESIGVREPLLHKAVVCPRVAGLGPVQGEAVEPRREPLRLHTAAETFLFCVRSILERSRVFDLQQQLIRLSCLGLPGVPQHSMLGVRAGLRRDGAVDTHPTVLQKLQTLVGLVHLQFTH